MEIRVQINSNEVNNLTGDAKITLEEQTKIYVRDIINEAKLLEEGIREDGVNSEITASIIKQAVRKNNTFRKRKPSKYLWLAKLTSVFSLLITGFLFDLTGYQDATTNLILFIIALIVACVSTIVQIILEEKE